MEAWIGIVPISYYCTYIRILYQENSTVDIVSRLLCKFAIIHKYHDPIHYFYDSIIYFSV